MKKRILALALAGTTAFSVFGMGVSAYEVEDNCMDDVVYANDVALTTDGTDLFVGGVKIDDENYSDYTWVYTDDADEAVEEGVEAKTIYVYDFAENLSIDYDFEDLEDALNEAFEEGDVGDLVKILKAHGGSFAWDYDSDFRDDVLDIWDDFVDGIVEAGDVEDVTEYGLDKLLNYIAKVDASESKYVASVRISLMNTYEAVMEEVALKDADDIVEDIDELIETLSARVEDDFASGRKYDAYVKALDKALDAYADADSVSEYVAVLTKLEAVAALNYAAAIDTDEAAEVLESVFDGVAFKKIKSTYVTYPEVAPALYTKADYDNPKKSGSKDPYDVFTAAYADVMTMVKASKGTVYQTDFDTAVADLADAIAELELYDVAEDWEIAKLDYFYGKAEDYLEGDYTAKSWKVLTKAMETAEELLNADVAGATAVKEATVALDDAIAALDPATIKTATWKELQSAIADAEDLQEDLEDDKTGSLAQYYVLKDAIVEAKELKKADALNSDVAEAIEALEAAMNYSEIVMGWVKTDAGWAYGTEDGYVQNGWYKVKDNWAYFQNGVALESQWIKLEGTWYYLNSYCYAARGWAKIDGKWYFFNDGCAMLANTTVDGYVLSASGAMVE